jgi:ketosteroid isomerase-like protein
MLQLCHPEIVLRPHQSTSELTGRQDPYRGHDAIRAYARDISEAWKSLELTPTAFRAAHQSVIVFGRADSRSGTDTSTVHVLRVWRLHDGLITSVEVFQTAHQPGARLSADRTPARHLKRRPNPTAARKAEREANAKPETHAPEV